MNGAALNLKPSTVAALQALADAPGTKALLDLHETERSDKRAAILARWAADEAACQAELQQRAQAEIECRTEAERLQAQLAAALTKLRQAEVESSSAQTQLERLPNRAALELRELGDDAIDMTVQRVLVAIREAQGGMHWRQQRDTHGCTVEHTLATPELAERVEQLQARLDELEGMRRAPLRPADIERRCIDIGAWLDAGAPPKRATPEARANGFDVFDRIWRRRTQTGH